MQWFEGPFLQPRRNALAVERKAWEKLEKCRRKLGLSELPLPIPIEEWIERVFGLSFGIADLSHLGPRTLGSVSIADEEILVSERLLQHEGRLRFTAAHELGHYILHRKLAASFADRGGRPEMSATKADRVEWQADRFAAAFLMPLRLIIPEIFRALDEHGLEREACLVELMSETAESEWLWRTKVLPRLTKRFGVSLTALMHRLQDVRLPDNHPFLPGCHLRRLATPAKQLENLPRFKIDNGRPTRVPTLFEKT